MIDTSVTRWLKVVEVTEKKKLVLATNEIGQKSKIIRVISKDRHFEGCYVIPVNAIRRVNNSKWILKSTVLATIDGEFEDIDSFVNNNNLEYDGWIPQLIKVGRG